MAVARRDRAAVARARAILALLLMLAACGCASPAAERRLASNDPLASAVRSVAESNAAAGFAGVVLVARGDQILLFEGYGQAGGEAIERDSRFWIASAGKQFVAAAILQLAERGRLRLDDPLWRFFPGAPPDKAAITIRQLLSHTSGLGQSYVSENQTGREQAVAQMLAEPLQGPPGSAFRYSNSNIQLAAAIVEAVSQMLAEPLQEPPGAAFRYSNSNIQLAAAIVEVISGLDYADFARRHLWRPAGLVATGLAGDEGAEEVLPIGRPLPPRLRQAYWGEQGAYSSAGDLFRWYRALRRGRILGPESLETLFAPVIAIGEGHSALGWFTGVSPSGQRLIFTRGNEDFGANSLIYAYPDRDILIIVLTHAGNAADGTSWSRKVHRELEAALGL